MLNAARLHLANLTNTRIKVLTGSVMNAQILFFLLQVSKMTQFYTYMMSSEIKLEYQTKKANVIFAQENFQKMHHLPIVQNVLALSLIHI